MSIKTNLKNEVQQKIGEQSLRSTITEIPYSLSNAFIHKTVHAAGHDLRSPLFVIRSYSYLLQKTQEKERLERGFNLMEAATYRMEKIINEFVGLIDIYTLPFPELEIISFEKIFHSVHEALSSLVTPRVDISWNFAAAPHLSFSPAYLQEIILQLLDNALRHNPEKKNLQVHISTKKVDSDIILTIRDNGKGIPDLAEAKKIKDPFYGYSEHADSIGMGLAKVQAIANVSQNNFSVQSQPDHGSCFQFHFRQ